VSFRDQPQPKDAGLEHVVAGWGAGGTAASPTLRALPWLGRAQLSELRRRTRLAAWGFVDQAWIEDRWPPGDGLARRMPARAGRDQTAGRTAELRPAGGGAGGAVCAKTGALSVPQREDSAPQLPGNSGNCPPAIICGRGEPLASGGH
jgi:hypothetical protein